MKNPEDFSPQYAPQGGGLPATAPFAPSVGLDYATLMSSLLRNWYWFVLTIGLCVFAAWLHLRYATPIYWAETSILIEERAGSQSGLSKDMIAEDLMGSGTSYVIANEIHMLKSSYLMEQVVKMLGIDISFVHLGTVRDVELYHPDEFKLLPADTIAESGPNTVPITYGSVMVRFDDNEQFSLIRAEGDTTTYRYDEPFVIGNRSFKLELGEDREAIDNNDIYKITAKNPASLAAYYASAVSIKAVERSGVVLMSMADPIPEKAKDILNSLVQVYGDQIIEDQSQTGGQTVSFIEERLDVVTEELTDVESQLSRFKQGANLSVDLQSQGANFLVQMNQADEQMSELSLRRDLLLDIRGTLGSGDDRYEPLPLASEVISPTVSNLIVQYNTLIFERANRLESATEVHPTVVTVNENLENLKQSILRSINRALSETSERIGSVQERIRPLQSQMGRIPDKEQRLLEIVRQQQVKQNLYMYLLEKREEAALTVAAQVPNTRIIDSASSTSYPISPNKTITYLLAIGIGLTVPAGIIFLRQLMGTTVITESEVSAVLPYSVVGRIVKSADHGKLVVDSANRSGVAEAFRLLRTNLSFLLSSEQSSVIMVTSSISGEGKSFIASNLGASLALTKKRVVIVGLDMRKPMLAEMVLQSKSSGKEVAGLSSYLSGKCTYEEVIAPSVQEGLSIIPSGPLPPNPAELLLEGRMSTLMTRLGEDFDVVIFDAPPVGIVTDSLLMKEYVNLTLFVVRLGVTPKRNLHYISEIVRAGKLPRTNLVFNGIDPRDSYGYGYGYYK